MINFHVSIIRRWPQITGWMNSSGELGRKCQVLSNFHPCFRRGLLTDQLMAWRFNCHPELMIHSFSHPIPFSLDVLLTSEASSSNPELLSVLQSPPSCLLFLLMVTAPPAHHVPQAHSSAVTSHSPPSLRFCAYLCSTSEWTFSALFLPQTQTSASTSGSPGSALSLHM